MTSELGHAGDYNIADTGSNSLRAAIYCLRTRVAERPIARGARSRS